jgi:hypothetical protein
MAWAARTALLLIVVEQYLADSHADDAPYDRLAKIVVVIVIVIAAATTDIDVAIDIDIPTSNVDISDPPGTTGLATPESTGIPDTAGTTGLATPESTGIPDTAGLPGMAFVMALVAVPETAAVLALCAAALAPPPFGLLSGNLDSLGGHHVLAGQHEFPPTRIVRQRRTLLGLRIPNRSLQRRRRQRTARD